MAYVTENDLTQRFGAEELIQLTATDPRATAPDADVLARAIADAEAEIDSYLAARYQLPLPAVPAVLTRVACDIARFRLWNDRASDEVRQRYEDARRLLEGLARGAVALGLPAAADRPQPSLAAAKSGNAPVFDRDSTAMF